MNMWFDGCWLQVTRRSETSKYAWGQWNDEFLHIRLVSPRASYINSNSIIRLMTRSYKTLNKLLITAKKAYKKGSAERIDLYAVNQ